MNNIINELKKYFLSNFGKLAIFITGLSFVLTLLLSVMLRNRIDISILKGLISAIVTMFILYFLNIALKKYLKDILENSNIDNITSSEEDSSDNYVSNNSNDYNNSLNPMEENGSQSSVNIQNDIQNDIKNGILSGNSTLNNINDINKDNLNRDNINKDSFNIDKNTKMSYHNNLRGDIGDIILNTPSYKDSSNISDSSDSFSYYNSDRKVNERNIEREVMDDPEKTATAIRTMIAKDKKDKKED